MTTFVVSLPLLFALVGQDAPASVPKPAATPQGTTATAATTKTAATIETPKPRKVKITVKAQKEIAQAFSDVRAKVTATDPIKRACLTRAIVEGPEPKDTASATDERKVQETTAPEKTVLLVNVEELEGGASVLYIKQKVRSQWIDLVLDQNMTIDEKGDASKHLIRIVAKARNGATPILAYSTTILFAPSNIAGKSTIVIEREVELEFNPGSVQAALANSLFKNQTNRLLVNAEAALAAFCSDQTKDVAVDGR